MVQQELDKLREVAAIRRASLCPVDLWWAWVDLNQDIALIRNATFTIYSPRSLGPCFLPLQRKVDNSSMLNVSFRIVDHSPTILTRALITG